ncbi:unnamed protein product [Trichogramma brassicae]|uniref:Uncharacterized protein n=1 Tax=Trichogramma brassicae TaxID=86971 RepID=A0A6H5J3V8_9HYME|nr:unnamed protein product [Trichogramma brassicae]
MTPSNEISHVVDGLGYDAYVVSGYASREVSLCDRRNHLCPYLPPSELKVTEEVNVDKSKYRPRSPPDFSSKFLKAIEDDRIRKEEEEIHRKEEKRQRMIVLLLSLGIWVATVPSAGWGKYTGRAVELPFISQFATSSYFDRVEAGLSSPSSSRHSRASTLLSRLAVFLADEK